MGASPRFPKVVVAPASFKGSLSAALAAQAIRRGVLSACPDAEVDTCPLSDGGEGLLDVLVAARGGTWHAVTVTGPSGESTTARWASSKDGRTAWIESSEAAGLSLVPLGARDPTRTTTFGVGELMRSALDAGVAEMIIGLGGTGTNDGGTGMLQALGVVFDHDLRPMTGARLPALVRIRGEGLDPRARRVHVVAASDVDNPLTGPEGAARVYAPQKGATPEQVVELEAGLMRLSELAGDPGGEPGDGAAGGLGYALRVFLGAERRRGIDLVLDAVRFDERLRGAACVITGEGRLDGQSARGKVVSGVLERAAKHGVPVVALVGSVGEGADELTRRGLEAVALVDGTTTEREAKRNPGPLLETLARRVAARRFGGA